MAMNEIFRYTFACGPSADLIDGAGGCYVIRARYRELSGEDRPWIDIPPAEIPNDGQDVSFAIDIPAPAHAELMLVAVDVAENVSQPVRYAWHAVGRKMLRMPGQSPNTLGMLSCDPVAITPPQRHVQLTISGKDVSKLAQHPR